MRASDTMTRRVITTPPELPLRVAYEIMQRQHIRHLPVTKAGLLLGIVSDRDLLARATLDDSERPVFPNLPVGATMTPAPYVCDKSTHVAEIVRTMVERKIDAIPVVDGADRLVGLVTSTDLMLLLIEYDEARPLPFTWELEEAEEAMTA